MAPTSTAVKALPIQGQRSSNTACHRQVQLGLGGIESKIREGRAACLMHAAFMPCDAKILGFEVPDVGQQRGGCAIAIAPLSRLAGEVIGNKLC